MRKVALSVIGFLALAAVIGFVATSGGLPGLSGSGKSASTVSRAAASPEIGSRAAAPQALAPDAAGQQEAPVGASLETVGTLPAIGPAIVKTASLTVQVPKGGFDDAFRRAILVAGRYGGYVESSSTAGTKIHSGSLTIRVPSASFDRAMSDLSGLGNVQSRSISGQDVTNEYVDLNARLRTWEAQEAVLLKLMRKANSIEETLRVQSNLQDVQFRIEQIKGELRVLENQTSLATIDVSMREPGAPVPGPRPLASERPSMVEAWNRALNGFLGVVYATVVGLGYLIPLALLALAVWFGYRRVRTVPSGS